MNGPALITEFKASGSNAAFSELVRGYANLVHSVAKRRLNIHSLAEDATQIVFARLATNPPRLKLERELVAWLHRTTVHVSIDLWRKETRRSEREREAAQMQMTTD